MISLICGSKKSRTPKSRERVVVAGAGVGAAVRAHRPAVRRRIRTVDPAPGMALTVDDAVRSASRKEESSRIDDPNVPLEKPEKGEATITSRGRGQ